MLPPRELASSGIDLDSMPAPRIEEIFGQATFTRPMPEHAGVAGQWGGEVLRPDCCDAVGGAAAAGPWRCHMPPPAFICWHILFTPRATRRMRL
jgi:hypothetical protein